jgi:amidase/6-aminohexanoate-cyclic-dimer hydrolase
MLSAEIFDSCDATALAERVTSGEVSPEELLDTALALADRLNPELNALVHVDRDLARQRIREGLPKGPLRGVPFLLKDLGAEAVDWPSHNGSCLLRDTRYPRNSTLVDRLNAAGVVIFGRTTSPEGGIGAATESRVYGGPTRNPWNTARTPGGSSGGSGAAVAAGIVPAAHGSDGGGSVRIPAACCGLFGFKATRARIPDGPFAGEGWAGMAIDGFLTRSVRDSALLLDIVQGSDDGSPYCAPPLASTFLDSLQTSPGSLRIGLVDQTFSGTAIHPEVRQSVLHTASLLEGMGHTIDAIEPRVGVDAMMQAWTTIVACGTALWIDRALQRKNRPLKEDDVEPVSRSAREYARTISGSDYLAAVERIHAFGREMAGLFRSPHDRKTPGVDVILSATLAEPPALIGRFDHSRSDYLDYRLGPDGVFAYSPFTAIYNASGQPAASLPLGWSSNGLPIGIQLACAFGQDELLMSLCADIERHSPWFEHRPLVCGRHDDAQERIV